MHPMLHEALPLWLHARSFALGDFILVMRKHQILAAEMQVEARSEQFHAHGAALDVPAGTAFAPRARPEHVAIFRDTRFPEGKIGDGLSFIFVAAHALPGPHLVEVRSDELAVLMAASAVLLDA